MAMPSSSTAYTNVRHKSTEGTLVLTKETLSFRPTSGSNPVTVSWKAVEKHQVSPASHSKALLKVHRKTGSGGKSLTFRFPNRSDLERVRKDVTQRLKESNGASGSQFQQALKQNKKRKEQKVVGNGSTTTAAAATFAAAKELSFGEMDKTALAVTRSSLLASNPTLRAQHRYLVQETSTVSEDDFWKTHESMVEEEYAKICGTTKAGTSSVMQSYLPLQGKVTLGVEEMRQIFILYPAVHRAYEEKVPLELSDEQFWRKYLESEFFHRDRGRLGTAARNHQSKQKTEARGKENSGGLTVEEQDARAAAVRADDLFSRYDAKLKERAKLEAAHNSVKAAAAAVASGNDDGTGMSSSSGSNKRKWGTTLAVGQFDLASTFETERGKLLEGPRDIHPPNKSDDGKGARVIQKYNRHWAMVLHPDEAVAGSNLLEVARKSYGQSLQDDSDAKPMGGVNAEMVRLVQYANAAEDEANHVQNRGADSEAFSELNLSNMDVYFGHNRVQGGRNNSGPRESDEDASKRRTYFSHQMAKKMAEVVATAQKQYGQRYSGHGQATNGNGAASSSSSGTAESDAPAILPPAQLGRELLSVLTRRMASDAKTDADRHREIDRLDSSFREKLHTYFRRSSELLRHFYGLRSQDDAGSNRKLLRIVEGLEAVYREMEAVRKQLPQDEDGETMRKMCLPIMDQLDWAFQQHRDSSGGFVTVEEIPMS